MVSRPHVLIIDDKSDDERVRVGALDRQVDASVQHPQDVTEYDLRSADLVLVDYKLDYWPERDNASSISLKPQNGLALAAVLREQARANEPAAHPIAFGLRSAHLDKLSGDLPPESREHALARAHNLEWVFPKTETSWNIPVDEQIVSLAQAVQQLPPEWPQDDPERTSAIVGRLLALELEAPWAQTAQEEVEECHPPLHDLSRASHGLAVLRWLLHSILPYPCFLWDAHHLAARLRVTCESLSKALSEDNDLARLLQPFRYEGILTGFLGSRWWRCGVEALVWELTDGDPFDIRRIPSALASNTSVDLQPSEYIQPVVCVDHNHVPLPTLFGIEDAVRIQPDDWPPYADQAWTTIALANEHPSLGALVISQDRHRLDRTPLGDPPSPSPQPS
jgi:hypothetical protein